MIEIGFERVKPNTVEPWSSDYGCVPKVQRRIPADMAAMYAGNAWGPKRWEILNTF